MFKDPYINILVSTSVIYIFLTIAIRISGKRELSQLSVFDLVFVLLISNAVQNAMVGSDSSLGGGLLAATTLFVINFLFKYLLYRSRKLTQLLEGEPLVLVSDGKVIDHNLRKLKITFDELMEAIREHGVTDVKDVNLAVFEVDGNISILSQNYNRKSIRAGMKRNKKSDPG